MTLRYRDVIVSRNSDLYRALQAGDKKLAERIYQEADKEFRRQYPNYQADKQDSK